jgi:hypothetical protein
MGRKVLKMRDGAATTATYRLLHVIVGHKFPIYFENAINSVLRMTTNDDILVVDNASNESSLIRRLQVLANAHPRVRLMLRSTNDLSRNTKVGGLYDAYNEVMIYALEQGYDYVHIMQHDMQMLWWDECIMVRAREMRQYFNAGTFHDIPPLRSFGLRQAEANTSLQVWTNRHWTL